MTLILLLCRVQNAEVLCLGLVSVAVFMLVMPLFKASGGILLQMAPPSMPTSALNKCCRQVIMYFFIFSHVNWSIYLMVTEGSKMRADYSSRRCKRDISGSVVGISSWPCDWLTFGTGNFIIVACNRHCPPFLFTWLLFSSDLISGSLLQYGLIMIKKLRVCLMLTGEGWHEWPIINPVCPWFISWFGYPRLDSASWWCLSWSFCCFIQQLVFETALHRSVLRGSALHDLFLSLSSMTAG